MSDGLGRILFEKRRQFVAVLFCKRFSPNTRLMKSLQGFLLSQSLSPCKCIVKLLHVVPHLLKLGMLVTFGTLYGAVSACPDHGKLTESLHVRADRKVCMTKLVEVENET